MTGRYDELYQRSLADPDAFWDKAAQALDWSRPYDKVLDTSGERWRWFAGGETNTCWNALDRHVAAGRGNQLALVHDSAYSGQVRSFTYAELTEQTARFAGALQRLGVDYGDRVLIYMSAVPEAVVAMLACARIGAIHSVVFGGFAARELSSRIADARPKLIVATSCGIEPGRVLPYKPSIDQAIELSGVEVSRCVFVQRPELRAELTPGRDIDWNDAMAGATPVACVPVKANDPIYILYTSGTTGAPKGIVRETGGHQVAMAWSMPNLYGAKTGEAFWAASDIGWAVGHSYIVYGPLLAGCTTIFYEGKPVGTPDAGAFWRVVQQHKVASLFCAPTSIRAIKRDDPEGALLAGYDISSLRTLFLAGERSDPATIEWASRMLNVPVIDHWWQTETGWAICGNPQGIEKLPIKPGSTARPMPGWDVCILDPNGVQLPPGETGAIACRLPLPPSAANTLWNAPERYHTAYLARHPGYYNTGDAGFIDADGYVHVMTRTDDVINVAGHRLSTGAIEEVIAGHPDVAECAVVGMSDALKGQVPLGLVVLKAGTAKPQDQVIADIVKTVRDSMGAVVSFKTALVVARLPKTRSGKILRGTIVKIADGTEYTMPATIEDPAVLDEVRGALSAAGIKGTQPSG